MPAFVVSPLRPPSRPPSAAVDPSTALRVPAFVVCSRRAIPIAMGIERSNVVDMPVGTRAPPFALPEPLTGQTRSLGDVRGAKGTLVAFLSVHCPFVIHLHSVLPALAAELQKDGVNTVAICANDIENYPDDAPENMAELCRKKFTTFPFLFDESQETALAYKAKCTPDFYLFDADLKLYYRGRLDASTPGNRVAPTGDEMKNAVSSLLTGTPLDSGQVHPSMGCSIKWKRGNAP